MKLCDIPTVYILCLCSYMAKEKNEIQKKEIGGFLQQIKSNNHLNKISQSFLI